MITDLIFKCFADVFSWIASLMPAWAVPSWLSSVISEVAGWMAGVGALGYFLPLTAISAAMVILLAVGGVGLSIRVIRIGASFLSGGGGGAA